MSMVAKTGRRTHISASFCIETFGLRTLVFGPLLIVEFLPAQESQRPKTQGQKPNLSPELHHPTVPNCSSQLFISSNASLHLNKITFGLAQLNGVAVPRDHS